MSRCRTNAFSCSKKQLAWSLFCSCAERNCENKWNKNVETGNNDEDCQESDAEADDEKTIDMIDWIMFKNYTCSEFIFF